MIYLDDIIVNAATFEEHLMFLEEFFTLLRNGGSGVKMERCKFLKRNIISI